MNKYYRVSLSADIMFVNGVRFFMTIARHIQFATCEMIADAKVGTIISSIRQIIRTYSKRGFEIENINMDIQFEPARNEIEALGPNANFVSRDEHVPEIERFIRTTKERARGIQCTLPFKKYPVRLTAELIMTQIFYWNSLPKTSGVSNTLSPRAIVTGLRIDYNHCKLRFGQYVQTHEESSNDTGKERTVGALALRPSGNQQGGYRFYSLSSGRVIKRNRWTVLPMPKEVTDRVHKLSRRQEEGIEFLDRNQQPLSDEDDATDDDDDDDDSTYVTQESEGDISLAASRSEIDDDASQSSNDGEATETPPEMGELGDGATHDTIETAGSTGVEEGTAKPPSQTN